MLGSFACDLALGGGLAPVSLEGQAANQLPGSQCVVTPVTLEFGSVTNGASRLLRFKVENPGTAPTALDVVSDRASFVITAGGGPSQLAPGDSLLVSVTYLPTTSGPDSCLIATGPGCPSVRGRGFGVVSFRAHILPIFNARFCASCHEWTPSTSLFVNVTSTGYAPAKRVVPFDLQGSVLYGKITNSGQYGQLMPEGGPLIPLSERDLIRDWILQGAQDN
jgi:hypothetical protein